MLDFLYFGAPFIYMPLSKEKADFKFIEIENHKKIEKSASTTLSTRNGIPKIWWTWKFIKISTFPHVLTLHLKDKNRCSPHLHPAIFK